MIISDLEHLEVVKNQTNLKGGFISKGAYAYADAYAYGQKTVAKTATGTFAYTGSISGSLY